MKGRIIAGRSMLYTVMDQLPYTENEGSEFYFCRASDGRQMIMQVCMGEDTECLFLASLFRLRYISSLSDVRLPVVRETITVEISGIKKKIFIMRFAVDNLSQFVPLVDFFDRDKFFDFATAIWMIRELRNFWTTADDVNSLRSNGLFLYAGGVLVNPESKLLLIYDLKRMPDGWSGWHDDFEVHQKMGELCLKVLACKTEGSFKDYEFKRGRKKDILQEEVIKDLLNKFEHQNSVDLDKVMDKFNLYECPFGFQDKPLVVKKRERGCEDDVD